MVLLIVAVAILSTSQILRYYFSYEDFSLLYGVQFPNDPHSIFLYPGFVAYLFLRPLVTIQYFLFGYNPFWYYLTSFALFLLVLTLFHWFMRLLWPQKKEISIYATAIMASGYLGIESLTWNVAGGQVHLALLSFSLLVFIFTLLYLKGRKKNHLILLVVSLGIALYFFQFRSYLLFIWAPSLIFFKRLEERRGMPLKLLAGAGALILLLSLLFAKSIQLIFGRIQHVNLDIGLLSTYLINLGNVLFPSDISELVKNAPLLAGILSLVILVLIPAILILKNKRLAFLASLFSLNILASLAVIMLVIAFVGQIPTVWPSSHRFYIVLLPFVSGYLAVLLSLLEARLRVLVLLLVLAIHIWFSNFVIGARWEGLSRHLKYFYTTITSAAPKIGKSAVLLTTLTRPYPPGPFVSGSDPWSAHFLAGFYHKTLSDFNLATTPLEGINLLIERNLGPDDIYAFDYKRDDILDETQGIRNILAFGKITNLGKNLVGSEIEINNLNISAVAPLFIKVNALATISGGKGTQNLSGGSMSTDEYFELYFDQERRRLRMIASSELESLGEEHAINSVTDGKYETTWIPRQWKESGASLTLDLDSPRKIYRIIWSSSRTAPWQFRSPSEYEVSISKDGQNFIQLAHITDAPVLPTGEFFTVPASGQEVQYVRLTIKKTHGGWTPAVDEIEVFDQKISREDLANYFLVKSKPSEYFSDRGTTLRFYREILKQKIPVEINWKVDSDRDYLTGQEEKIYVEGLGVTREYMVLLPKVGRTIKSIRIRPVDFPSNLTITRLEAWQPSLREFRINKELLGME